MKRWSFALEYDIFCCIIWEDDISFSRNNGLVLSTKNQKWTFSKKKKKRKNDIFFKRPEKTAFPKKIIALEYDLSVWYVFFGQKMKDDYFQETNGNMIFSVYTNMILRFCKKILKMILYRKNALKEDWHSRLHPRNSSSDLLYFYGDLHRRFHILLSSEKKKQNKKLNI